MGDGGDAGTESPGEIRVLCKVDVRKHGLDVEWTNGAAFQFDSERAAERWVARQDRRVPGTFYCKSNLPGEHGLDADLFLNYHPPGE